MRDPRDQGGKYYRPKLWELHEATHRWLGAYCDVFVDARCFYDPTDDYGKKHTGHHPMIIASVCENHNLNEYMKVLKKRINAACNANAQIIIGNYCKSGRHRSVAATYILQHVLRQHGWTVDTIKHLSAHAWGKHLCKGRCPECRTPQDQMLRWKTWALEAAVKSWSNA